MPREIQGNVIPLPPGCAIAEFGLIVALIAGTTVEPKPKTCRFQERTEMESSLVSWAARWDFISSNAYSPFAIDSHVILCHVRIRNRNAAGGIMNFDVLTWHSTAGVVSPQMI